MFQIGVTVGAVVRKPVGSCWGHLSINPSWAKGGLLLPSSEEGTGRQPAGRTLRLSLVCPARVALDGGRLSTI